MKNILKIIIGLIIIAFTFWNRVIRERVPQYYESISTIDALKYLMLALIFLCLIIYTARALYISDISKRNTKLLLSLYLSRGPRNLIYERITRNMNLASIIEQAVSYFTAYLNYPRVFVILFYFIPQILISLIFFIEIFLFHQHIFFFKILSIAMIYIIAKTIIFIFRDYSTRRLSHCNLFFDIKLTNDGLSVSLKAPEELPKHIPLEDIVNQYDTMYLYCFIYLNIQRYMLDIDFFYLKYNNFIRLVIYSSFFFGWLYLFSLYFHS